MTVSSTSVRSPYSGNGVTTAFSFPNFFIAKADLYVYQVVTLTGVATLKTLTTDYTIAGTPAANGTYPNGGTVNMIVAPPTGTVLVIINDPTKTQATHWVDGDPDPAAVKELAFDKLTLLEQRRQDLISRSVRLKDSFTATFDPQLPDLMVADSTLVIDPTGQRIIMGPTVTTVTSAAASAAAAAASATAAAGSATAAAGSATSSATSTTAAAGSAAAAAASATAAAGSATAAAASAATAAAASGYVVYGSTGSPLLITGAGGITASTDQKQMRFIAGSGGPVSVSANPQISAGTTIGQEMLLIGTDDTNTVTLAHGTGLVLNGACVLRNGAVLSLIWGGSNWIESSRNSM